ncbi:MAG: hypothetical protein AB4080_00105 [Trichodesmium sp.]
MRSQTAVEYQPLPQEIPTIEAPTIKQEYDWVEISTAMRGENGVSIKDEYFSLNY